MRLRVSRRVLALATGLAAATAAIHPAAADPIPGGCIGLPSEPAAFVCIEYIDPEAAPPGPGSGGTLATVPAVCYFLGCTAPTEVPAPGIEGSGTYAVVHYNGQTYTVTVPPVTGIDHPGDAVFLNGALAVQRLARTMCEAGGGNVAIGDWVPEKEVYWYRCENGDPTTTQLSNELYGVALTLYLMYSGR